MFMTDIQRIDDKQGFQVAKQISETIDLVELPQMITIVDF
jgi:hypothetical protein